MDYKKAMEVLGLNQGYTDEELQKNYRGLVKKYHPDNYDTGNEDRFMEIKEAYAFLLNSDNIDNEETNSSTNRNDITCPVCNGNGWRRQKVKTARGYMAQKIKCSFCNGMGRK